ncbi:unnamed protein product [Peronospora belbahrii]|uniref:Uncharacterized protein n=1 Tax=Peronospora belbahrii TaxID=622444 RepID=A0ABN8D8H5_9STRA|nr:unnamed protein product [Peronospora belbahrii]
MNENCELCGLSKKGVRDTRRGSDAGGGPFSLWGKIVRDIIAANGVVQTITRKYDEYRRIIGEILIPPSVIIRKEYSTFEEAEKARLTDGLPSDGVIIIEKNTSITYRIKKPTIDLLCYRGDMQILLQGRRRMHVCAGLPGMKGSGTIYECNVEPDGEDNLRVVRAIPRTDKVRPNSRSVLSTVLALLRSTDDVDYTLIDRVSSYSFRVREYIYRRMENMGVKSGFTVDIGSGRMQSLSIMSRYGDASYLVCDPDLNMSSVRDLSSWINVTDLDSESMLLYSRSWREEGLSVHITEEAPNTYSLLTRLSSSFVSVATPSCIPSHFLIWWKRLIGWLLPGSNRLDVATFMTGSGKMES